MGFHEDAVAAAEAARVAKIEAAKEAAEAQERAIEANTQRLAQEREMQAATARALVDDWLAAIDVDPSAMKTVIVSNPNRRLDSISPGWGHDTYSFYHRAVTTLAWSIEGYEFQAEIIHADPDRPRDKPAQVQVSMSVGSSWRVVGSKAEVGEAIIEAEDLRKGRRS
jgi:hypothetical protein